MALGQTESVSPEIGDHPCMQPIFWEFMNDRLIEIARSSMRYLSVL